MGSSRPKRGPCTCTTVGIFLKSIKSSSCQIFTVANIGEQTPLGANEEMQLMCSKKKQQGGDLWETNSRRPRPLTTEGAAEMGASHLWEAHAGLVVKGGRGDVHSGRLLAEEPCLQPPDALTLWCRSILRCFRHICAAQPSFPARQHALQLLREASQRLAAILQMQVQRRTPSTQKPLSQPGALFCPFYLDRSDADI